MVRELSLLDKERKRCGLSIDNVAKLIGITPLAYKLYITDDARRRINPRQDRRVRFSRIVQALTAERVCDHLPAETMQSRAKVLQRVTRKLGKV